MLGLPRAALAGLTLVAIGCTQPSSGDRLLPDKLVSGPLSLDENLITASLSGNTVTLAVPVALSEGSEDARVEMRLINLAAERDVTVAKETASVTLSTPGAGVSAELSGVQVDALGDLAKYVVEAVVTAGDHRVRARRSLFSAVSRLALHAIGSRQLAVNSSTVFRSYVRDASSGEVVAGAVVDFGLQQGEGELKTLGSATSDASGLAELEADLTDFTAGAATLRLSSAGASGQALLSVPIDFVSTKRIQVTTDKPRYQPGQTMHLRVLAVEAGDRSPSANQPIVFEIFDGAENRVHRHTETSNAYGVAAIDFKLADRVNEGTYLIRTQVGETAVEERVIVERYRLPRMLVTFQLERSWLSPGGQLSGSLSLRYPFGQPVPNATIELLGDAVRDGAASTVTRFEGRTNAAGQLDFQLDVGRFDPLLVAQGKAAYRLTLTATDSAGQRLQSQRTLPVAGGPSRVLIQPSAGRWLKKVAQPALILVTNPGGQPIQAELRVTLPGGGALEATSNASGVARIELPAMELATELRVDVLGAQAHSAQVMIDGLVDGILVAPEKRFVRAGEALNVDLTSSHNGRVLVDALREGKVLASSSVEISDARATAQLNLPTDLHGGVQIRALQRSAEGALYTGLSLVHVDGGKVINVAITPEKPSYRPGENARLAIQVRDAEGNPQQAAVGLTAVDESVFGLSPAKPGVSESYFDLGLRPGQDQSPAPSVSINRALSSRDETVAEAAFARLSGAGATVNQDSEVIDQAAAKTHLTARLQRELDGLVEELKNQWEAGDVDFENYEGVMERMLTGRADPFGKIYQFEVGGWQATLVSSGADEVFGTVDDLRVAADLSVAIAQQRGAGFAEADDMAAGAPEQADPGQPEPPEANVEQNEGGGGAATGAPRVRSWFPETLIAAPMIITDEDGRAEQGLRVADSITTWKIAAQANSATGHIGSGEGDLIVFQPFFVDLDLPVSMTRGDEVHVPVIVYNYLEDAQRVALTLQPVEGMTLIGGAELSVELGPREVKRATYILRAERVGTVEIEVQAIAGEEADAVRRSVRIQPDGDAEIQTVGGRLGAAPANVSMNLAEGVEGANELLVKLYPGLATSAVEGIDSMLKMPSGCFEQTTSTAWPNIMVYNYLLATGQDDDELLNRAIDLLRSGYQRILTFESPTGGYNWWGNNDPGNRILTAIALWQFADLEGIIATDEAVADRHRAWLIEQQATDGSWPAGDALHAGNESLGEDVLRSTAYIATGLHYDGKAGSSVQLALRYLRARVEQTDDLYAVALVANLFALAAPDDPLLTVMLNRLVEAGETVTDGQIKWAFVGNSWTGARGGGTPGEVEMTGLVVQAMLQAGQHAAVAADGLTFLAATKDAFGNWYSTQATMNSLRALTLAAAGATANANGTVEVLLGDEQVGEITLSEENADVHHTLDLSGQTLSSDTADIALRFAGEGTLMYQVIGTRYEPWSRPPAQVGSLGLSVTYDRSQVGVGEIVRVDAEVTSRLDEGAMDQVIVSVATAPGMVALADDLNRLVESGAVQRFERTDRRITFYLMALQPRERRQLRFGLQATRPVSAQHPPSRAYSYYNPDDQASTGASSVVVDP